MSRNPLKKEFQQLFPGDSFACYVQIRVFVEYSRHRQALISGSLNCFEDGKRAHFIMNPSSCRIAGTAIRKE